MIKGKKTFLNKEKQISLKDRNWFEMFLYAIAVLMLTFSWDILSEVNFGLDLTNNILAGIGILLAVLDVIIWGLAFFHVIKSRKQKVFDPVAMSIILGFGGYSICEIVNGGNPIKTFFPLILLGCILYSFLYMIGVLLPHPKIWFILVNVLCLMFTIIQYYVIAFRGTPIRFADLFNLSSAFAIKSEYQFHITIELVVAFVLFLIHTVMVVLMNYKKCRIGKRILSFAGISLCLVVCVCFSKAIFSVETAFSRAHPDSLPKLAGSLNTVFHDMTCFSVNKSDDYLEQDVIDTLAGYKETKKDVGTPIVIGILNESLADFTHVADFDVNRDTLPVWRSLDKDVVKGYVSVSEYGGGTCNSEYEFLTGNSMMFLPDGSTPFTIYIKEHKNNLVDAFKKHGFATVGLSPVVKMVWDIEKVYERLGFDQSYFLDSEKDPLDPSTTRDSIFYNKIKSIVDHRDKSKGLFVWAATIQNHSPYTSYYNHDILLKDPYDAEAEAYLNSEYISDQATRELIDAFKDYDEKVIIVMFGDHFPALPNFDKSLLEKRTDLKELEKVALIHQTPFFIWSNRGLFSKEINEISLNYLSDEVFKAAGIPLTDVQQELEHVRRQLPIVTAWGYKDRLGLWHAREEEDDDNKDIINEYASLCYYRLFSDDS